MWCWMCFWLGRFPWARQAQPGPLSRLRVFPLWVPWYIYGGISRAFLLEKSRFHREKLLAILKVGLPTAIQMVVVNTAYLLVTGMLNQFGTPVAAASGVGLKINTFAGMHCWAIGQAQPPWWASVWGAGQIERARKVVAVRPVAEPFGHCGGSGGGPASGRTSHLHV